MKWNKKFQDNGECGCPICGKMLKGEEKRRYIHVGEGGASIMRADLPLGGIHNEAAVLSNGTVDTGDMGWFAIGSGCAKKLGLEWSKELPPLVPPPGC